jgi:hypothetical protein
MTPHEAVEAPRFKSDHFYSSFDFHEFNPGRLSLESRRPRDTVQRLIALDHPVQLLGNVKVVIVVYSGV